MPDVMKSTVGGDLLAKFDKCILPHPQEIDQNFYFLIKSPHFACTPPPHGVNIDSCITFFRCQDSDPHPLLALPAPWGLH